LPDYKKNPRDSMEVLRILKGVVSTLHEQSYIAAQVDTILFGKDTVKAFISIGRPFHWVKLTKGNVDGYLLDRTGFREKF